MADDITRLVDDMNDLAGELLSKSMLTKLGLGMERKIKQRTRRGVDYLGEAFEPYSEAYATQRRRQGLPTSPVTLEYSTGRANDPRDEAPSMLSYLDTEADVSEGTTTVLINNEEKDQIAVYHNIEGAGRSKVIREFMGISEEDQDDLAELIDEEVDEMLKRLSLK